MFNEELYKELEQQYGVERMIDFAEIMTTRYDILDIDNLDNDGINQEDYERGWWYNKYIELKNLPKDRVIEENNEIDDFIYHLQEELMDSINRIEKLKNVIKEHGYISLSDFIKI